MPGSGNKILKEEFDRLKKIFEKIISPKKKESQPQWVLQPYRNPPKRSDIKKY